MLFDVVLGISQKHDINIFLYIFKLFVFLLLYSSYQALLEKIQHLVCFNLGS